MLASSFPRPFSSRAARLLILFSLGVSAGCSNNSGGLFPWFSQGSPATPPPTAAPTTAPTAVAAAPADQSDADALAAKVASYTHDVEPQLARAAAKSHDAPTTGPADMPLGTVNWLTPDSLRLTEYHQHTDAPRAPMVASATILPPTALASGDANFPMVVPESVDHSPPAVPASATQAPPVITADQLEHRLAAQLRDYPKDLEGQLDYELLMFIEGQAVPQMSAIAPLSAEDREILSALMDGLTNFRTVLRSQDNVMLADKTKPLAAMADRLRTQSELNLPTVALCNEVKSYGVYRAIDSARFIAGRENQVIVYCEVQNFQSRLTSENLWQTQLSEELVLYTESGLPVWPAHGAAQPVSDLCHQRRHDFFVAKLITLPANLTIGRYLLKMTVTDEQAKRVAETTTPVEIVSE